MPIAAAFLLALQATPAVSAERPMLDAFRTVCEKVHSLDGMKAAALASGWEEFAESAESRIERLNKLGRDSIGDGGTTTGANYRRTIGDRTLFLLTTRYEDKSGFWGNGCRLYHFEAGAGIPGAELEAWMGKPPTGVQEPAPGLSRRLWEPSGWRDGITVEVSHVPQKHPLGQQFGLSGNIIIAQAIGGL